MAEREVKSLAALLRQRSGDVPAGHDAAERERLLRAVTGTAVAPRRPLHGVPLRWVALAAVVATLVGTLVAVFWRGADLWPERRLEYAVRGGSQAEEGYVQALDDGATLELAAGSATRIVELRADGARVLLERGRLDVHVQHRPNVRWVLAAGPYAVWVTGTRFALAWDPVEERLTVDLHEGSVIVRGPMVEQGVELHQAQALSAHVPGRELSITELAAAPEPSVADNTPAPEAPAPAVSSAAPEASSAAVETESWTQMVAAGKNREVLDAARARGIGAVLGSGSLAELVALGDAARYSGEGALSQKAFMAVRERFPQSDAAHAAAFMLGRMSEGSGGAVVWYDRYLAEAPRGPYAADALGRKLALLAKSDPGRARGVAQQYLQAYPKGPYARLARELLRH
jgi:hypothetical protein